MGSNFTKNILIFTDGACSGNPGPGGFGTVIVFPDGEIKELGKGYPSTTNNRMEMQAVISGLRALNERTEDTWILTDSTYVIRGITQWIWGWRKKGWKTAEGKEVTNKDLWMDLDTEVQKRKKYGEIEWKYVRGHTGNPGNERCDEIGVGFSKKKYVDLYSGSLLNYHIAIHDLPEDMSLPAMRAPGEKKKSAYSYLSYVNNKLERHKTWKECEARVKGRSGAKFKKSTSASDEVNIVNTWGLNPNSLDKI